MEESSSPQYICNRREDLHFEAKEAKKSIPKDAWETYSSFANTDGGTIVFGIKEDEDGILHIVGTPDAENKIRNRWNVLNDRQMVSVNLLTDKDIRIKEIDEMKLIIMDVPRADRRDRPVFLNDNSRNSFIRNGESDRKCTRDEIDSMISDSLPREIDSVAIESLELSDLDSKTISSYRNSFRTLKPEHPWNELDDHEFLRVIGAAARTDGGGVVPTMAGLLMFGNEYTISSIIHNYSIDYREYADDSTNDWHYRLLGSSGDWSGNLFSFYQRCMNSIRVALGEKFHIDENLRRSENSGIIIALREAVVNALVNADYRITGGISIELRPRKFIVRNPGTFRIPLDVAMDGGISDPRNRMLAKMFMLIGISEIAGSGMLRMRESCRSNGFPNPEIEESFRIPMNVKVTINMVKDDKEPRNTIESIIDIICKNDRISITQISEELGISRTTVNTMMNRMKEMGILTRVGGTRGRWVLDKHAYDRI